MKSGQFDDAVALLGKLYRDEQFVLVAVDGHSAAGKSTFARKLQTTLPDVQLVHGDDFYRVMDEAERFSLDAEAGYRRYFDPERLTAEVLGPLSDGRRARYRVYDWTTGGLGGYQEVTPHGVVIVEGVFSARPELRRYYDACLLVETPPQVREKRQQQRPDTEAWIERWEAAERFYLETHQPHSYADLVMRLE